MLLATAAASSAAVALAHVDVPRPPTLCVIRALTGVPCPLCGGTTAAVELGQGHLGAALAASPLLVLGLAFLLTVPLLTGRQVVIGSSTRTRLVLLAVAVVSELWQLHRFGFL